MNISFSRELDGSFLLVTETEAGDSFTERMLSEAHPPMLLPLKLRPTQDSWEYRYEISGLKSLESRLSTRAITADEIRDLMRGIYRISNDLEEYLLEADRLWLSPGLIFSGKNGWCFCLHPGHREDFYEQLQALTRFLLKKIDHEDEEASRIAYALFQVCHEDNFCFTQIFEAIEGSPEPEEAAALPEEPAEEAPARSFWDLFRRH